MGKEVSQYFVNFSFLHSFHDEVLPHRRNHHQHLNYIMDVSSRKRSLLFCTVVIIVVIIIMAIMHVQALLLLQL